MSEIFIKRRSIQHWILFSLPMIGVWIFFLLIFFPGFVTDDAFYELRQFVSGHYNDWHPILYAILIGLITKIHFSPASVVIFQILIVSIAFAWGLGGLADMGVSRKILWMLAILCSIAPFNISLILTLWKDAPYSVCLLILSVIFLKTINTHGQWLRHPWHWLGLGFTLSAIALFRLNGFPVAFFSVFVLILFFRNQWKRITYAAGFLVVTLAVVFGPVYSTLHVKHVPEFGVAVFLHHIAAHINAGTPLTTDEREYLGKLAPLDSWRYDCCVVNPTLIPIFPKYSFQNMDLPILKEDINKPISISLALFLRNPGVDLHHMACASELVWKIGSKCGDMITESLSPLSNSLNPVESFRISRNEFGFKPASVFPLLIPYGNLYLQVNSSGFLHEIFYTPAIYLYLTIVSTLILAIRSRRTRFFLFLTPVLLQSLTLILINQSQSIRYQFGVLLVGLLSIGFIFVQRPNLMDCESTIDSSINIVKSK
jgi:hypothetical protein